MNSLRFDGFWSEELVDVHQTVPYQPGALLFLGGGGAQLFGGVSNPV